MSVFRHALPAQLVGLAVAATALKLGLLPSASWALAVQAGSAALCALVLRSPPWWIVIHLIFTPSLALGLQLRAQLDISSLWFLLVFAALLLIYGHTHRSQVPLYLSNQATVRVLSSLLPSSPVAFLDPGAGLGGPLRQLARQRPDCRFTGIELALGPWLLGHLLCRKLDNIDWRRGDLFASSWAEFDLVYTFLSPVPMAAVWAKAQAEMRPGSVLISNSFAIPGVEPSQQLRVADRRQTRLLVYRIEPTGGTHPPKRQK